MRVIAGKFKSRILKEFKNPSTRPTLDRVKEAIFSKLHFYVEDAIVLDLFSGTGALGIEALSRGAKEVYFVDKNKIANSLIKENLCSLNSTENSIVLCCDYESALQNFVKNGIKFDIVLLDPPFRQGLGEQAVNKIIEFNLLNENAIIVLECGVDEEIKLHTDIDKVEQKNYGTVKVFYYYI